MRPAILLLPILLLTAGPARAQVSEAELIRQTLRGAVHNLRWEPAGFCVYRKNGRYRVHAKFFNWVPTLVVAVHNRDNPWNLGRWLAAPGRHAAQLANAALTGLPLGHGAEHQWAPGQARTLILDLSPLLLLGLSALFKPEGS